MKPRPIEEYSSEMGDVLWWQFPVEEPPYCGSPNDIGYQVEIMISTSADGTDTISTMVGGWPGYHTHFTEISVPDQPTDETPT